MLNARRGYLHSMTTLPFYCQFSKLLAVSTNCSYFGDAVQTKVQLLYEKANTRWLNSWTDEHFQWHNYWCWVQKAKGVLCKYTWFNFYNTVNAFKLPCNEKPLVRLGFTCRCKTFCKQFLQCIAFYAVCLHICAIFTPSSCVAVYNFYAVPTYIAHLNVLQENVYYCFVGCC